MRRTLKSAPLCVLICLGLLISVGTVQAQDATPLAKVQIHLSEELTTLIPRMEIDLSHGHLIPGKYFVTELTPWEIDHIRSLGFRVDILIADMAKYQKEIAAQRNPVICEDFVYDYPVPENFKLGAMGGYLTYSEILDELDLMQLLYPQLVSGRIRTGIEETHQGRNIFWIRLSDNPSSDEAEPEVLYTGLQHAREPMSMMQMIYFMWYLLEGYGTNPEATYLLNNTELYFIPCVNPDGYIYNQQTAPDGNGMWRKNMRDNNEDGEFDEKDDGVDINRNYGYQWGADNEGSSGNPSSQVYRGPAPFSEPESRAIREFIESHDISVALNYHSYGNFFIYPWGYTQEHSPDHHLFENYGELMALDNGYLPGTSMETVGYPTNGGSDDWMYAEHDIHAMTPEIGEDFWPAENEIIPSSQACLKNNLALAHLPLQFAIVDDLNGAFLSEYQGEILVRIKSYGKDADMALTITSLTPGLEIDADIIEVQLDKFEEETYALDYQITGQSTGGDEFTYVIQLDNGFFEVRDTVTKILAGEKIAFSEDGVNISDWITTGGNWGVTNEFSHTGGTSLTDSPHALYNPNGQNLLQIAAPINLENAFNAVLEFWMKWEIEELIDFAQVQISTDGQNFEPLCGIHTKPGSVFQTTGPVYDGYQPIWVKESIDLSPYVGNTIHLRFTLMADGLQELDGLYIDDLKVYVYDEDITGIGSAVEVPELKIWPNPASDLAWVSFTEAPQSAGYLACINSLGTEVRRTGFDRGVSAVPVSASGLATGLYILNAYVDGRLVSTGKVVIE